MGTGRSPLRAAGRAGNSDPLEHLARVGLIAYGVVHLLVAWLALQLAWGGGDAAADQSGAMSTLADSPVGRPLLWVVAVGLIALAAWQATEILHRSSGWSASGEQRTKALVASGTAAARTLVYAALAVLAIGYATGAGESSAQQQQQTTAGVFSWPAGRWLVGAAGLAVIGIGLHHVYQGLSRRFLEEIDLDAASPGARRLVTRLGQIGFPAKGVALGLVGGLLGWASVAFDPERASGLDGAMRLLLDAPLGQVLLGVVALGLAAFGAYCFVRARYPERT